MQFDFTAIFQAILALLGAIITYWLVPYVKSKATAQQQANGGSGGGTALRRGHGQGQAGLCASVA